MLKSRKTNDFGRYRRLLIEGTYTLKVSADGYETYFYEFVPSSSVVTVHDVTLIKKPEYNVNFNIEFPDEFDEEVILVFENDFNSDTLFVSLDDGVFEYSLSEEVISQGNHQLKIFSENLFPELFDYSIESDTTYNIETKWKGVLLHDDFSDNSCIYGRIAEVPRAQLKPTLNKGACEIEFKNASTVCPDNVLPLSSVIVPEIIIGILMFLFSKTSIIAKIAALQFKVSKTVSTIKTSTPPSINPLVCSS